MMFSPTKYTEINIFLEGLYENAKAILGANFAGMYLGGSLALGAFDEKSSDIDFLVSVYERVSRETFSALGCMHHVLGRSASLWAIQLDGSYIPVADLATYIPDQSYPHIDRGLEPKLVMERHDMDWIFQYHILQKFGITLAGQPIQEIIQPITAETLRKTSADLFNFWWKPIEISESEFEGYRTYALFSLCRILYTYSEGAVASKVSAAQWVASKYPQWQPYIELALKNRNGTPSFTVAHVYEFIEFVSEKIAQV